MIFIFFKKLKYCTSYLINLLVTLPSEHMGKHVYKGPFAAGIVYLAILLFYFLWTGTKCVLPLFRHVVGVTHQGMCMSRCLTPGLWYSLQYRDTCFIMK